MKKIMFVCLGNICRSPMAELLFLEMVKKVLSANGESIEAYKKGKTNVVGFLVGQVMKESKGKANPKIINQLVSEELQKM